MDVIGRSLFLFSDGREHLGLPTRCQEFALMKNINYTYTLLV
jgi:hypothetical protein